MLAAAALRCVDGQMQGRLLFEDEAQRERARQMGDGGIHRDDEIELLQKGRGIGERVELVSPVGDARAGRQRTEIGGAPGTSLGTSAVSSPAPPATGDGSVARDPGRNAV